VTLRDLTVVIVPGLRDHVADHWQTLLVPRLPRSRTVEPLAHDKLSRAARVAALQATLAQVEGPVVLVAHSAGVMTVAHWASQHRRDDIVGALLATPADLETPLPANYPALPTLREHGWLPIPRAPLPFPAIVAASRNDPLARFERAASFAADWGASLADLGEVGPLNPAAGYGEWPQALDLLAQLMQPLETTP
jgi:predicted alpha/beta hydrolase family esterase